MFDVNAIWSWLNTPPGAGEVLDPHSAVYLVVFALGFVVSTYLAGAGAERVARNAIQLAGLQHWATAGLWIFGAGLFFFGMRALQINTLSFGEPLWLAASVMAMLIAVGRCVDWWKTVYPAELEARNPGAADFSHQRFGRSGDDPTATSTTNTAASQ